MNGYLFSLFLLIAVLSILELLSAERHKKITSSALSILIAIQILIPISDVIKELSDMDFPEIPGEEDGEYTDVVKTAFEEGIKQYIANEFSLRLDDIEVEAIDFSMEDMNADRIIVTLKGSAVLSDNKKIKERLREEGLGQVEVKIEI